MTSSRFVVLVAGLLALRQAAAVAQGAALPAEPGIRAGLAPGDDFFTWANGAWLDSTRVPAGRARFGVRDEIVETTRRQLNQLLDDALRAPAGSRARRVGDFRAAYLDEAGIEARGLAALQPALDSIERIQDRAALAGWLGRDLGTDVDPLNWGVYQGSRLVGLAVEAGIHGESTYRAFLVQGGLGLPDRENYLSAEPRMQELRTRYQQYLARLLSASGGANAERRAAAVMALETALARSQGSREQSANDHNADSVWQREQFVHLAPGLDWAAFFAAAGLAGQDSIVVWQPGAVRGLASLAASQPLETWKDYLRLRLLDRYADLLPRAFAEQSLIAHGLAATGEPDARPRAERAMTATQSMMSDDIARLYVERYFPAEYRTRIDGIVRNVATAFRGRVAQATWMAPATRTTMLAKLDRLYVGVGYPETWPDQPGVAIDPRDALGNIRRLEHAGQLRMLARLGRPVDDREWWIAPQRVGALLNFQLNAYNFSAALLQPTKFDPAASDAANYGAIGAIIGHDITHFVDLLGAEYGVDGALAHWWTAEDHVWFLAAAAPLDRQVAAYQPGPGLTIDPARTRNENVADLGGLVAAFDAYRASLGSRLADTAFVREQDREFFIGFARSWRGLISDGALAGFLAGDPHAPEAYRIAIVRNLDAWYSAFDVQPGQRLYLAPGDRVRIW